jgi:hypothetical protein
MKPSFSKILRIVSILVFALGLITVAMAYGIRYSKKPHTAIGFKMNSTQTFTPAGGNPRLSATIERFQKADGGYKLTNTYYNPDGSVQRTSSSFAQTGRGVFRVDENSKTLNYLSPKSERPAITEDSLRKNPQFIREEDVLGYKTFVARIPDDDGSAGYTELYQAIALQGLIIKMVAVSDVGTTVIEPIKIEVGEPDARIFENVPNYPVNYTEYEQKIQRPQSK